ncbi:hypothetical protein VE03_09957 [Pseudogymnoascus sp. 23342-1-I1]|nr:hypothetical protein VE03_09957 [Pseudogymnoascus sp. 23342-1-I1]
MGSSQPAHVQLPFGEQTVDVSLICAVNFGPAVLKRFMSPLVPQVHTHKTKSPSLSFLIQHPSGRKLVWDLGIRKDYNNYAPSIANYIPTTGYEIDVTQNVVEVLEEKGIKGEEIEAVIWSHWHWDHIGDPSTFPQSTDLIVGAGFKAAMLPAYPRKPDSPIRESDFEGRTLREISFSGSGTSKIGRFPAYDYFGDGSFYLLDSPGHAVGHLCALARTTKGSEGDAAKDTFILLGGDVCHYPGIFRPSERLPVPDSISPHPCCPSSKIPFCPGGEWEKLQQSRGRKATDSLYDIKFGLDIPLATKTVGHLQDLDCDARVLTIIAHDSSVRDGVEHFPATLNDWYSKGWGENTKWAWFRDLEPYWRSVGLLKGEQEEEQEAK